MSTPQRLALRQSQALVMTPQLRQAIKLLHSSNLEVAAFVEEELERNPLLERDERPPSPSPDDGGVAEFAPAAPDPADSHAAALSSALPDEAVAPLDTQWENVYDAGEWYGTSGRGNGSAVAEDGEPIAMDSLPGGGRSLREHLDEQVRLTFSAPKDRLIAAKMIALLDPAGRLEVEDGALARALGCEVEHVVAVRARLQRFDPVGLFCRDLRECLSVQLAERNRFDPAMRTLLDNLPMVGRRDRAGLMAICGVDAEDLTDMMAELRRLDLKPGADFNAAPVPTLVPDLLMRSAPDGTWAVELNPETVPRVLVRRGFHARAVVGMRSGDDRAWLAERLQSANWLVRSLEQRAGTIVRVASEILRCQDGFFRHGVEHLRPLVLRDVADAMSMHESTVSRVTANKHIATPRGIFELKYFFTTAIAGVSGGENHSAEAVRHRIRSLIEAEPPEAALSDDTIVERLRREGVEIARRTVAKYRDAMRIPSSVQRKREKIVAGCRGELSLAHTPNKADWEHVVPRARSRLAESSRTGRIEAALSALGM
jgi:RNA polymerase sigma-54 factor